MRLPALALLVLGTLGTFGSVIYFVFMQTELNTVGLVMSLIVFGMIEAAGALLVGHSRR